MLEDDTADPRQRASVPHHVRGRSRHRRSSVVPAQGAWIAPLGADGDLDRVACPIRVQARMSSAPCSVNTRGVCDLRQELATP
jgi:hypothetical protein